MMQSMSYAFTPTTIHNTILPRSSSRSSSCSLSMAIERTYIMVRLNFFPLFYDECSIFISMNFHPLTYEILPIIVVCFFLYKKWFINKYRLNQMVSNVD